MSSLGIRNVLPYTGANGIVVKDNVISIDTQANILLQNIEGDDTFTLNLNYNGVVINQTNNSSSPYMNFININSNSINLQLYEMNSLIYEATLNYEQLLIYNFDLNQTILNTEDGALVVQSIQTTKNTTSAPIVVFDSVGIGVGVPNANLSGSVDGVPTSININQ